jgi:hypothetical protein
MSRSWSALLALVPSAMLCVVGVIHLLPLAGVLGPDRLARLYGLAPVALADPNLLILLRHRAVLFGVLGLLLVYAAFDAALRWPALAAAAASAGAFVWLARAGGAYNAHVGRVVLADVAALACVAVAVAAQLLAAATRRAP